MSITLTIEPKETESARNENKTNAFSATLLALLIADHLWDGGATKTNTYRPVFMVVGGNEASIRPFIANLRNGRKAVTGGRYGESVEMLKSGEYTYTPQTSDGHTIYTIYQETLFAEDPGLVDPLKCQFISAPTLWWANEIATEIEEKQPALPAKVEKHLQRTGLHFGHLPAAQLIPIALHFCNHLDRRTGRPLVNDVLFRVQLYQAALKAKCAEVATDKNFLSSYHQKEFTGYGLNRTGIRPTLFNMWHDKLDSFLAQQVQLYRGVQ